MKIAVIADSHTRGTTRTLPAGAWPYIETVDHILHAGDVCDATLLDELSSFAPVTAVIGNSDGMDVRAWGASTEATLELDGIVVSMVHDSGPARGRHVRMAKRFPDARVVVFGHSHLPLNEERDGLLLFNPGSPTWKRRAAFHSMGLLWIQDRQVEGEIFPV